MEIGNNEEADAVFMSCQGIRILMILRIQIMQFHTDLMIYPCTKGIGFAKVSTTEELEYNN